MIKKIFTLLIVLWAVNVIADDVPRVYDVENTGTSCSPPALPVVSELPSIVRLPNPFAWADGHGTIGSYEDWSCRRAEIKDQIENYEIGVKPDRPDDISATYSGGILTVTVKENGKSLVLTSTVVMPTGTGPFPVIIGMNSPTGSLSSSLFEGCIQIPFMHDQVATMSMNGIKNLNAPFYQMYPKLSQAGDYCAWSWGISRLIDGIELVKDQLNADLDHIGVSGCSYAGKMALFAGAFDERIALTIAQESGGGGIASWRVSETLGNVENLGSTNYSWFMPSLKDNFNGKVDQLPYDHHELIAMIAPRAFLALGNDGWTWLADESGYVACMAAREVWKFMGVEDRMGFDFTGGHNHCAAPDSQNAAVKSFVDRFLRGNDEVNTSILTSPYQNVNYQFWISGWANVKEPDVPLEQNWIEAESESCAIIGSDLAIQEDSEASNGKYVTAKDSSVDSDTPPDVKGLISIPFTVNNHRDFQIYFRANSPSANADDFWVQIDNNPFLNLDITEDKINADESWKWIHIATTALLKGSHKINIGFRKKGVKLDKIYITNDSANQNPEGMGENETGCISIPSCIIFDFETGNIDGWAKQNPGKEIDITQEDKHSGKYALKMANGTGTDAWSVQAFSTPVEILSGHQYNVSFWVRAVGGGGRGRISTVNPGQLGGQYWADFTVGDDWQQITYPNLAATANSVQLAFDMGYIANKVYYIDDIVFEDITADPKPVLEVQGAAWDAGEVLIKESKQSNRFSMRNIGTGILEVTGLSELSAPWSTTLDTGNGLSLGAGQVREFSFSYSPVSKETSAVDFVIHTNAGDAAIELTGKGTDGTGISTIENPNVKIYSSSGKIHVNAVDNSEVKITDILGRIKTSKVSGSSLEIPVCSGIYVVSVMSKNKIYTQKVVVK